MISKIHEKGEGSPQRNRYSVVTLTGVYFKVQFKKWDYILACSKNFVKMC